MFAKYAQYYLDRGLSVIPVRSNKHPAIPAVIPFRTKCPTPEEIAAWSRDLGDMNIAAICGKLSNLFVVDADTPEAIAKIESLLPEQYEVPSSDTPKDGHRHYYFHHAPGFENWVRCRAGIDIRTEGGYVLLPPSRTIATKDGKCVTGEYVHHDGTDIKDRPQLPEELAAFIRDGKAESGKVQNAETPPLTQGRRTKDLFHAACVLVEKGLPQDLVNRIIVNTGKECTPPYPEKEALAHVAGAWKRCRGKAGPSTLGFVKQSINDVLEEPILWLWKNVFPTGVLSIITGNPSVGKTLIAVWLASKLSNGQSFPRCKTALQGCTLYMTRESPAKTVLKPRLVAAGADCSKITHISAVYAEDGQEQVFDIGKNVPLMDRELDENPDIKLIVPDPIISFLNPDRDTNSPGIVRNVMDQLAVFADKRKVAVVVLMHLNKNMAQDIIQRNSGSIQFMAAAQIGWVVAPDSDPEHPFRKLMMPCKNNLGPMTHTWPFDVEAFSYQCPKGLIETARVVSSDAITGVDVTSIISPYAAVDPMKLSKMRQAESLLRKEVVSKGPKDEQDLEQLALDMGISANSLHKAKKKLGIDHARVGSGKGSKSVWFYEDPSKVKS